MKHFREQGYEVFRSAGSHSKADVIAMKRGEVILIQCKTGKRLMSKWEGVQLKDLGITLGVETMIAYREGRKLVIE